MFKTKTFIFVLEAPRDKTPGLEDYITGLKKSSSVAALSMRLRAEVPQILPKLPRFFFL